MKQETRENVVQCMYNVCTMYVQCMYNVCTMYAQCMYNVCTMYVQCRENNVERTKLNFSLYNWEELKNKFKLQSLFCPFMIIICGGWSIR